MFLSKTSKETHIFLKGSPFFTERTLHDMEVVAHAGLVVMLAVGEEGAPTEIEHVSIISLRNVHPLPNTQDQLGGARGWVL